MKKYAFLVLYTCFLTSWALAQSVLSTGEVYKIKVSASGIYKISASQLSAAGLNLAQINPQHIRLHGNGGGMLAQANATPRPHDVEEIAIQVIGEEDGRFDEQDFILFYAEGADKVSYHSSQKTFLHQKNVYDDANYYFLTIGNTQAKRIKSQPTIDNVEESVTFYDDFQYYEKDESNILATIRNAPGGSGREWFGEKFDFKTSYEFKFSGGEFVPSSKIRLQIETFAYSTQNSTFRFALNGLSLGMQNVVSSIEDRYAPKGNTSTSFFEKSANEIGNVEDLTLKIDFTKNDIYSFGHLNYVRLYAQKVLKYNGKPLFFQNLKSLEKNTLGYRIQGNENASSLKIWDISEHKNVKEQLFSANSNQFIFGAEGKRIAQFALFQATSATPIEQIQKIENQHLQALSTPHLLIITHPLFVEQAENLATWRKGQGLEVAVCTVDKIYNEFSSGRQDITALRDFIRYLYLQNKEKLKYVLLFGDASFDYKNRISNNTNFVPTYESLESLHPIFSHSSDDYFGLLDANEGEWTEIDANKETVDIGIGRLPVRNVRQAATIVQKIKNYESAASLGDWRNKILFVADDGDFNLYQKDSDKLSQTIENSQQPFLPQKLYIDAYPKEFTENGKKSPHVRRLLSDAVQDGVLLANFMGHGSEVGWTLESILDIGSIAQWRNLNNLPFFFTATCEFGRYDNPSLDSGGEQIMMGENGGGIGLVTTTRPVYASTNFVLAESFYAQVFKRLPDGNMPRLGDLIRHVKQQSIHVGTRNFALLGDPSMRLNYPKEEIYITQIQTDGQNSEEIKALSKVNLQGEIRNFGQISSDFNGELQIVVYDQKAKVTTLGDDAPVMTFDDWQHLIFKGKATVRNGKFSCQFTVPKDIHYATGSGKILLYAQHETQNRDASGFKNVITNGSSATPSTDTEAPQITLFLGDESFKNEQNVESNVLLLAHLADNSGINATGIGIGHDILAFLDGEEGNGFILNAYFETEKDDSKSGKIRYPLQNLPVGKHTLTLRAWDTHNNSSEVTITFYVESPKLNIKKAIVYPNPTQSEVNFAIAHNRQGEALAMKAEVFDIQGRKISVLEKDFFNTQETLEFTTDLSAFELASGIYWVQLSLKSYTDAQENSVFVKIVVLR